MADKKGVVIILFVALIVALSIMIYFIVQNQSTQSQLAMSQLNISTPASVFDSQFHDLLQEHTFLLVNTIRRSLDSSMSFNASLAQLQTNIINEVGALLQPLPGYGAVNASQLVNLWNLKTQIFINYSNAVKAGDPTANAIWAAAAANYETQITQFWTDTTNAYPLIDKPTITKLVTDHMNLVKATVDAWNAQNYPLYFADLELAYKQAGVYSDIMANAIIQQNAQYFLPQ